MVTVCARKSRNHREEGRLVLATARRELTRQLVREGRTLRRKHLRLTPEQCLAEAERLRQKIAAADAAAALFGSGEPASLGSFADAVAVRHLFALDTPAGGGFMRERYADELL